MASASPSVWSPAEEKVGNSFIKALQPGGILERAALFRRPFNAVLVPRQCQLEALKLRSLLESRPDPAFTFDDSAIARAIVKARRDGKISGTSDAEEMALTMRIPHPDAKVREFLAYFIEHHLATFDSNGFAQTFTLLCGVRGALTEFLDAISISGSIDKIQIRDHIAPSSSSLTPHSLSPNFLNIFLLEAATVERMEIKMRLEVINESLRESQRTLAIKNSAPSDGTQDRTRGRGGRGEGGRRGRGRGIGKESALAEALPQSDNQHVTASASPAASATTVAAAATPVECTLPASDFADEVEMLQMMFQPEELTVGTEEADGGALITFRSVNSVEVAGADDGAAIVAPSADVSIEIRVPPRGYPDARRPMVRVTEAPNVTYSDQLERAVAARLDELDLGIPMLALLINAAQEEIAIVVEAVTAEAGRREAVRAADEAHQRAVEEELASMEMGAKKSQLVSPTFGIKILRGEIIHDRKSGFLAHLAKVGSIAEVEDVVRELAANRWLAASAHPTIYAYRFIDREGRLSQDAEDDGEDGASKKMLFLLEQCKVLGYVLVVTRWFGGILLGPDRFKRIMECSRQALQQHGVIE